MSKSNLNSTINALNHYWHHLRGGSVETINNEGRSMYLSLCIMQRAGQLPDDERSEDTLWPALLVAEAFKGFGHNRMYNVDRELYGHLYNLTVALGVAGVISAKVLREWANGPDCPTHKSDSLILLTKHLKLLSKVVLLNVPLSSMNLPDDCNYEDVQDAVAEGLCI